MRTSAKDSIVAIATAPGRGGIGVVRISGGAVIAVMQAVCDRAVEPRVASYVGFIDARGQTLDRGIALYFPGPNSYTGEDVLELQAHGGPVVLNMLVARCLEAGADHFLRLARPGEFTERAFLNDKMDLAQAEAVSDLIEAGTELAARRAQASLQGAFSDAVNALVASVTELRMLVEATLDFPEEEQEFLHRAGVIGRLELVTRSLDEVLERSQQGAMLRSGLTVVLAGRPNVGKSSMLNALAGAEVAIVTPVAGTTRDRIVQTIQIEGIALDIIDTAGLRDSSDPIEQIGIARTWESLALADVVVMLHDASDTSESTAAADAEIVSRLPEKVPRLVVYNKIDLIARAAGVDDGAVFLSALHDQGIGLLRTELLRLAGWHGQADSVFIARERHLTALHAAAGYLHVAAEHARHGDQVLDLFAEELRLAQDALSSITGAFSADDLLGAIFGRFCIGK